MTFLWPWMLWFLALVPLGVAGYLWLQRRRQQRLAASYGSLGFSQAARGREPRWHAYLPVGLFLTGLAILLVGLARPQALISLPKIQGTVILAFDVSGSMAATDFDPTRIDAAKAAARDFISRQPSTLQIGIVAFSDNGFSVQKPTNDPDTLLAAIDRLTPQRGTSLGNGILVSLNTIAINSRSGPRAQPGSPNPSPTPTPTPVPQGTYVPAVIVLLTDGENNETPNPLTAAKTAVDRGVKIYTIGIGSPMGTNLHVNGFTVHTQLNEELLQQIADTTGGAYYNAANAEDLHAIYENLTPQLTIKPEKTEITSIFAGASILLLLIGGVFSLGWFGRLP